MDNVANILSRGVGQIYPNKEALEKLLRSGKKLRLYQGFDPSMPSLHLGNLVGVMKLRHFQKLGHEVIFLIGDFTGMIGDPTDKLATRKQLTREQVLANSKTWQSQIKNLLDFDGINPVKILHNSDWLDSISFKDLILLTSHFTVQQMLERDMFQNRLKEAKPIHLHEFLYPIAQAIDSVNMDVDMEIGGSDQTFNMLAGRTLMQAVKGKEKFVLTTKLLVDKDGNKAGKTSGNALFLDSTPDQFFGGIMSFPDELIFLGFELLTEVNLDGLPDRITKNPMAEKKNLATEIVSLVWGREAGENALANFENTFQKGKLPENIPTLTVTDNSLPLIELLVSTGAIPSKSEAKRLLNNGAVELNGLPITSTQGRSPSGGHNSKLITVATGDTLKVGKTRFFRIQLS